MVVGDVGDQEVAAQAQAGPPHILRRATSRRNQAWQILSAANPIGLLIAHTAHIHNAGQLSACYPVHLSHASMPSHVRGRAPLLWRAHKSC